MQSGHGSQNLAGGGPDALAAVQTVLQAAALIATWVWFARGPADARAARPRVRRGRLRVRRLRQGALAAVPDLARPARPARRAAGAASPRAALLAAGARRSRSSGSRSATGTSRSTSRRSRRGSCCSATSPLVALFAVLLVPTGGAIAQRLDRRSAAVGVAVDDHALEPDAALGRAEAHGHPRAHAPDRQVGLDADHRVVRPGHPGVGDRRRPARLDARVARLDVRVGPDHGRDLAVEPARDRDLLARRLGVEVDDDDLRLLRGPPRRARRGPRTARAGRRGTASPSG